MDIEYITIDSDSNDDIIWIEENNEKQSFSKKRELSIENITSLAESDCKRIKNHHVPQKPQVIPIIKDEKTVFTLAEFWLHDERLDQNNYFNKIEDYKLDIDLLVWCQMEVILDVVERNSICYTVEHYYHMLNNKNKFLLLQNEYNALFEEYRSKFENTRIQRREDYFIQRDIFRQKIKLIEDKAIEANKEMKRLALLL
ncbi:unnamed protein product, partial [Brachionus calyciflorus]